MLKFQCPKNDNSRRELITINVNIYNTSTSVKSKHRGQIIGNFTSNKIWKA